MWDLVRQSEELEKSLLDFVGLASEWDDDPNPSHRDEYDRRIREAARHLAS